MNKNKPGNKDIILDAATVAGCCVGVGFLSGKEAQVFFGGFANVAIFAVCFFALNIFLRCFCRVHRCFDVASVAKLCFGRFAGVFTLLFLLCSFVCVVTMLAGVESCLGGNELKLPAYGIAVALISAFILKKGLRALKILNVAAIVLALAYLVAVACISKNSFSNAPTSVAQPVKYALFSVTMSVGVLAPLSDTTKKGNIAATAIATCALCALIVFVLWIADFSLDMPIFGKTDNVLLNVLGAITAILATVTGVVANTLPITQCIGDVFEDDTLCYTCIFCIALALSMFGFDFALTYGYLFVALVGIVLTIALAAKSLQHVNRKRIKGALADNRRELAACPMNGEKCANTHRTPQLNK